MPQRGNAESMHAQRGFSSVGAYDMNSRAYQHGGGMLMGTFHGGHSEHANSDTYRGVYGEGRSTTYQHSHRDHERGSAGAGAGAAGTLGRNAGSFQGANARGSVHSERTDSNTRRGYESLAPRIGADPRQQDYRGAYAAAPVVELGGPAERYPGDRESRYERGGGGGGGGRDATYRDRSREYSGGKRGDYGSGSAHEPQDRGSNYGVPGKQGSFGAHAHAGMQGYHETAAQTSGGGYHALPGSRTADGRQDSAGRVEGNAGYQVPYTRESGGYKPRYDGHGDVVHAHGRALPHSDFDGSRGAYFGGNSDSDLRLHVRNEARDHDSAYMASRGGGGQYGNVTLRNQRDQYGAHEQGVHASASASASASKYSSVSASASASGAPAYSAPPSMPHSHGGGPDPYSQGAGEHASRGTVQYNYGHHGLIHIAYGSVSGQPYGDPGRYQQAPGRAHETEYASAKRQRY
jgi:hypothetical protein